MITKIQLTIDHNVITINPFAPKTNKEALELVESLFGKLDLLRRRPSQYGENSWLGKFENSNKFASIDLLEN